MVSPSFFHTFSQDYNAFLRHETLRVAVLQLFDEAQERLAEAEAAAEAAEAPGDAGGAEKRRKLPGKNEKNVGKGRKTWGKMLLLA